MESELKKLSETAGVDLLAIREKYKNKAAAGGPQTDEGTSNEGDIDKLKKEIDMITAMKKLDSYTLCKTCHGVGTVVEIYNHFRMEKNCPECDGDSVSHKVPDIPGVNA